MDQDHSALEPPLPPHPRSEPRAMPIETVALHLMDDGVLPNLQI